MQTIQKTILFTFFCFAVLQGCQRLEHVEVKKAKVGDVELAYYTRGSGEPLVMIMGFRGTMAMWDPALLDILEKKFQLILFDHRGVGLSSDTPNSFTTMPQMAQDTIGLIQSLGFKKAHILGWSMGSIIALEMGLKYPEAVETMILCSPPLEGQFQEKENQDAYKILTSPDISEQAALSLIFPKTIEGEAAAIAFVGRIAEGIFLRQVPNDMQVSKQTIERQVQALKQWDSDDQYEESLSKIKVPTLVAGGLQDILDPPKNVRKVASRIPFAWSAYFPEAGHAFLSQNHQNFANLVVLFIESNQNKDYE